MRLRTLLPALLLVSPVGNAQTEFEPREVIDAAAQAVADVYFDEAKGARIAAALRAEAKAGKFDRHDHPAELASALTSRLQPEDGHFSVLYSAAAAPSAANTTAPRSDPGDSQRRGNHGFRRVEILPGNIGYIALGGFAGIDFADPDDPARQQADAALALIRNADAVIIDVSQSPGGRPEMVGYLVSAFTPPGADIYNIFHYRDGKAPEAPGKAHPEPRLETPMYILTSSRSASAAEGFAYTLQAAGRAEVVGEISAGGANPGGFIDVGNGFRVFISSGSPVNPITGRNWEGTGVIPDHKVSADQSLATAQALALKRLLAAKGGSTRLDQQWALQALEPPSITDALPLTAVVGHYQGGKVELKDGELRVIRGRRGVLSLAPVGNGEYAIKGDASVRLQFVADDQQRVTAFELYTVDGIRMRFAREG